MRLEKIKTCQLFYIITYHPLLYQFFQTFFLEVLEAWNKKKIDFNIFVVVFVYSKCQLLFIYLFFSQWPIYIVPNINSVDKTKFSCFTSGLA